MYIFARTHYSIMRAIGGQSRALFKTLNPESAEKIAANDAFIANAGTYELSGTMLTTRPIIAKNPNFMGGGFDTYEIQREGETLWLNGKSSNIRLRLGDGLAPSVNPAEETRIKLVRIE